MHIEKRAFGKKIKYYLAHSYREGVKVHKFRKYLGQDLTQEKLNERKRIAEKLILEEIHKYNIIKDPLSFELSKEEIKAIKKLESEIPLKISHLSERGWRVFSELFTYNTNAIEGRTLNQKKKKKILKNSKPFAGKLRKKGEEVVVLDNEGNVVHQGAPQARICHLLQELTEWCYKNKSKYPSLVLAAVVHNQFENIHPFRDGNGRVGRILLNNILIKHGLPPINIDFKNRMEYYASLRTYETYKDLKPTIDLYMKEYRELKKKLSDYKK